MNKASASKKILANWKANLSPEAGLRWCDSFAAAYQPREGLEVLVAVPALCMERVAERLHNLPGLSLTAQGLSSYPQGNYTGSLPAAWLRNLAPYALLGHQERRRYFHETVQDVARQAYEALAEGLKPIVCVDDELLVSQPAAMASDELEHLLWAYTPATPRSLEMARDLKDIGAALERLAPKINRRPVLYGGGLWANNMRRVWEHPGLAGALLGQACLDAEAFAGLIAQL